MKELKALHCYGQKYVTLEKKTKAVLLLAAIFVEIQTYPRDLKTPLHLLYAM